MPIFQKNCDENFSKKLKKKSVFRGFGSGEMSYFPFVLIPPLKIIFWEIFAYFLPKDLVEKLVFFETLDHPNPRTAWLTSVKFWNMNICLNLSNFSKNGGIWKKKWNFMQAQKWPKCKFCWFCSDKVTLNVNISATVSRSELKF